MALEGQMHSITLGSPPIGGHVNTFDLVACYPFLDRVCFYLSIGTNVALS